MPIYSANRTGSLSMDAVNENYTSSDIGRIMYESEVNDRAIFEAIIRSDFNEMQALKEGTLLESEVRAMNEASISEFFANIRDRLAKFWAKIKAAFKIAAQKIAAYVLKDGSAFVKDFNRQWVDKKLRLVGTIDDVKICDYKNFPAEDVQMKDMENYIRTHKSDDSVDKAEVIGFELSRIYNQGSPTEVLTPKDFQNKMIEKCFKPVSIGSSDIEHLKKVVSEASELIKKAQAAESSMKKQLKELEKSLKDAEKEVEAANKSTNVSAAGTISNISTLVGAFETVVSTVTSTCIKCLNLDVKCCRKALSLILSRAKNDSANAKHEAAAIAEDEVDLALDPTIPDDLDAETQEAVDAAIEEAYSRY